MGEKLLKMARTSDLLSSASGLSAISSSGFWKSCKRTNTRHERFETVAQLGVVTCDENTTYRDNRVQNADVVRLGAEQVHEVIVAHRLLLRLGGRRVQTLFAVELQHTGAGRVVEQTARGGQQAGVRHR